MQHTRMAAIDRLRGAIVVLVVLHHAMLAYASFAVVDPIHYLRSTAPIVDPARWAAVDLPIVFNDGFFMPALFLLSGLLAWPALRRRGAAHYATRRVWRLGLPFVLGAALLMPLAHYPALLARGDAPGFATFWWRSATQGPWPSGPLWFVWLLLAFDTTLAVVYACVSRRAAPAGWMRCRTWLQRPAASFVVLLAASLAAYLPLLLLHGADHWFAFGPFAVQASRVGLYAAYFALGAALGAGTAASGQGEWLRALGGHWIAWTAATLLAFVALVHAIVALGAGGAGTTAGQRIGYGTALCLFAALAAHGGAAIAVRFAGQAPRSREDATDGHQSGHRPIRCAPVWDSLAANGYGIYLLHYLPVIWLQYALLARPLPPACKAAVVFSGALAMAWAGAAALRRTRAGKRVL